MSQAWEQAPVDILSSIAADQLSPDTVIPRMKEVWSHKSGRTMLPQQEKPSTSGALIILKIIDLEEDHLSEEVVVVMVMVDLIMVMVVVILLTSSHNNNSTNGEGTEAVGFASIEEYNDDYSNEDRYHPGAEMPYNSYNPDAAQDFDIAAIEMNHDETLEYSPAPPAVENVYTPDMETFLGSHTIGEATTYDPDLTQQDIDMAMSNVGNSQTYRIDGSTGELSSWFLDEIQGSYNDRVESVNICVKIPQSNSPCTCSICLRAQKAMRSLHVDLPLPEPSQWKSVNSPQRMLSIPPHGKDWIYNSHTSLSSDGMAITNVAHADMVQDGIAESDGIMAPQGDQHINKSSRRL
ncbi:hypothetical protein BKA82DRAFT_31261 [Pisolithus tinctorius]|uniref:Uncharacterized protein n=1 Tax=Pisolithus tinctorius Marx 270 TaxID=870435 RepID=A0A0C3INS0_PISTI|nr:hypothetical protein BKA82DRAFT_31261 [Pisolithus tinctorius]KIN98622.1 hypothetical protein M404DRAFT_31261 [Pisolithus tinctorius Marx 270]